MIHHFLAPQIYMRSVKTRLFKIAMILMAAIGIFSFLYWQIEKPYNEGMSYSDAIQSILIFTISGFDADPPHTIIGWVSAIISLMLGIVLVGAFTAEIASIFVESRLKEHSAVKDVDFKDHIIFCGALSDADNFFSQLFHPDHGDTHLNIVFLIPQKPSIQVEKYLSNKKFKHRCKYIIGSPLDQDDLVKANAHHAKAAFIFTDRFAENPENQDAKSILIALAIESFNQKIDTYVQLLESKNKKHLEAAGADNIICMDELSHNLIAYSCLNPGLSEMLDNLLNSSSSNESENLENWQKEYEYGADQEIYRVKTGAAFSGLTFSQAASSIYKSFNIAAIAMEKPVGENEYEFAVNPGNEWKIETGDYIFVIADDADEANKITQIQTSEDTTENPEFEGLPDMGEHGWKGRRIPIENAVLDQVEFEGHIIICGAAKGLAALINPLRSEDLVSFKRIVVLAPKLPEQKTLEKLIEFNEIFFVLGNPNRFSYLDKANVSKAEKAMILANPDKIDRSDEVLSDADTIMSVMGIETTQEDVYTLAELMYASNIKFLKPQVSEKGGGDNRFEVDEVITISRIADTLITQEYYTPHIMQIFNELFAVDEGEDNDRNTCEFYLIPVPDKLTNETYGELFKFFSCKYGILPIGLYRTNDEEENYVYTNPPADTLLRPKDSVYVLAPDQPVL